MISKLLHLLRLETAADSWWDRLDAKGRKAYIKAHPRSKYAKKVGAVPKLKTPKSGPKTTVTVGDGSKHLAWDVSDLPLEHLRQTKLPKSKWSLEGTDNRDSWLNNEEHVKKKTIKVHPSKLRATQSWIDSRWTPKYGKENNRLLPNGILDSEGNVHILNGHHRADYAVRSKKPLQVDVREMTPEQEKRYIKGPRYGYVL